MVCVGCTNGPTYIDLEERSTLTFVLNAEGTPPWTTLELKNNSDYYVAYKIEVTAPTFYIVHPAAGVFRPRENKNIEITMCSSRGDGVDFNSHFFKVRAFAMLADDL